MSTSRVAAPFGVPAAFLRSLTWARPDWWVVLAAAAAWGLLALAPADGFARGLPAREGMFVCMVVAMMVPLRLPAIRYVAASSLWSRRQRAIAGWLLGYLGVWAIAGAAMLAIVDGLVSGIGRAGAIATAFAAAIAWTLAGPRRSWLRRCATTIPLRPRGLGADADAVRHGAIIGWSCVASCGAVMAAAVASHSLAVMAALTGLLLAERAARVSIARTVATALVVIGLGALALDAVVRAPI